MAKTGAVWGIDIGQCAIKALRCRPHETDADRIVVEAFDYIEYPKLLSQPDAEPEELVSDALKTFLSRNEIKGDRIAMSVPGQSGLARFIKLPPVESKKIPDIVKYEARQQIPFALEDVVWDYEALAGGSQEEGFALETEIGLFAMKRDQVATALEPLKNAGIDVDHIQLAPLSVYNFTCFDLLDELNDAEFDPASQPASTVILSIGVDTTDLVITNGYRVWQRNIPIGGSHFTKALTKELKLTFTKAEHLKRNATKAEDPKSVFQAMRPVFSDLVAEVQRSIGFFTSNNRNTELGRVVTIGNAMKLPGLQRYLGQNLDLPVESIDEYRSLSGGSVTANPAFEQNRLSFPVAYGLCIQALGKSRISTNLLPTELITERMIRAKKPWAVAAASILMAGMLVNYSSHVSALQTARTKDSGWSDAIRQSQSMSTRVSGYESDNLEAKDRFNQVVSISDNLQSNEDGRALWLEMYKAIKHALPKDERPPEEKQRTAEDVSSRTELHITSMDCQQYTDLSQWFVNVQAFYDEVSQEKLAAEKAAAEAAAAAAAAEAAESGEEIETDDSFEEDDFEEPAVDEFGLDSGAGTGSGPSGEGWVIQLVGHHFHNQGGLEGEQFVRETFIRQLEEGTIQLPDGVDGEMLDVTYKELGIDFPVVVTKKKIEKVTYSPDAAEDGRSSGPSFGGVGMPTAVGLGVGNSDQPEVPEVWKLRRYDFILQFAWTPTPKNQRQANRLDPSESDEFDSEF